MDETDTVTLVCGECSKTFQAPREAQEAHAMVACPHCSTLQPPHLESEAGSLPPHAGIVKPSYRKDP
jgi:DNA-directed RNA polymerase subunit RPC12/RpoP